jgi:hypothetical protein
MSLLWFSLFFDPGNRKIAVPGINLDADAFPVALRCRNER